MNFDKADIEITSEDRKELKALGETKEWQTLRRIVEGYILQKVRNLAVGTFTENNNETDYLKELRGFARIWRNQVVNLIEKQDEKNQQNKS